MPLPRPCKDCEKKFQPTSRTNFYCHECRRARQRQAGIKRKKELRKKYPYYYRKVLCE